MGDRNEPSPASDTRQKTILEALALEHNFLFDIFFYFTLIDFTFPTLFFFFLTFCSLDLFKSLLDIK